jgi:hypothetical protein
MATKKARVKRSRQSVAKRSTSKKKTARPSAAKKSSGRSVAFKKATRATVLVDSHSAFSPYARRALDIFSAGVQRALKQLAQRNIPAVVVENGKRVEAVPTKVAGRYIVVDAQATGYTGRGSSRKRGVRAG